MGEKESKAVGENRTEKQEQESKKEVEKTMKKEKNRRVKII